jgi:hypothetical protein
MVLKKTLEMSYPSELKLEPKLCETLFLILAMQSDAKIHELTGFSIRAIGKYKEALTRLFSKRQKYMCSRYIMLRKAAASW